MKQLLLYSILALMITGCVAGNGGGSIYKEMISGEELIKYKKGEYKGMTAYYNDHESNISKEQELKTEKCVYGLILGILPPLNFWDVRFTDKQDINYAIKKFQKQDPKIKGLRYISTSYTYVSFPVFGWGCTKIEGFPIYDDITK